MRTLPDLAATCHVLAFLSLAIATGARAELLDPHHHVLTLEQKMATINAGHLVTSDDVTIARFRFLMTSLAESTGVDKQMAADMIATAKDTLRTDYGKQVGLLDLTEAVYRAQALAPGSSLAEIVATAVSLIGTR